MTLNNTSNLKIAVIQQNFTTGDLSGNFDKTLKYYNEANSKNADLVLFTEMNITGYPCEDLVLLKKFQNDSYEQVKELAKHTKQSASMIVGGIYPDEDNIYNALFLLKDGKICNIIRKVNLPNFGVFDEKRTFTSTKDNQIIQFEGFKLGVLICEDLWTDKVPQSLANQGAEILISLNASPFEARKHNKRILIAQKQAIKHNLPLIYINQIGGQDELVFDGSSFALDASGKVIMQSARFAETIDYINFDKEKNLLKPQKATLPQPICELEEIYKSLVLGLKDYVNKNGFSQILIGMSGGIDSAISAVIASDAIGAENVTAVMMPSRYTSNESIEDAQACIDLIGIKNYQIINIEEAVNIFDKMLESSFANTNPDLTEENIQSRIRGNLLMALSNKFGQLVLTTGNKSEMAVGYATLYGDMCGGFNALKDVYKTTVYQLATWRNEQSFVIPKNIINKAPTAELRENQRDDDSLPSYDILDDILYRLVELQSSTQEIIDSGVANADVVLKIARLIKLSEYKRKQAPIGVKVSSLDFDKDRRYPITNKFCF